MGRNKTFTCLFIFACPRVYSICIFSSLQMYSSSLANSRLENEPPTVRTELSISLDNLGDTLVTIPRKAVRLIVANIVIGY